MQDIKQAIREAVMKTLKEMGLEKFKKTSFFRKNTKNNQ